MKAVREVEEECQQDHQHDDEGCGFHRSLSVVEEEEDVDVIDVVNEEFTAGFTSVNRPRKILPPSSALVNSGPASVEG
ncbi:hypothetical protein GCM10027408_23120 [Microbacterium tumbae]